MLDRKISRARLRDLVVWAGSAAGGRCTGASASGAEPVTVTCSV